jgi:hypothetical protein
MIQSSGVKGLLTIEQRPSLYRVQLGPAADALN